MNKLIFAVLALAAVTVSVQRNPHSKSTTHNVPHWYATVGHTVHRVFNSIPCLVCILILCTMVTLHVI